MTRVDPALRLGNHALGRSKPGVRSDVIPGLDSDQMPYRYILNPPDLTKIHGKNSSQQERSLLHVAASSRQKRVVALLSLARGFAVLSVE